MSIDFDNISLVMNNIVKVELTVKEGPFSQKVVSFKPLTEIPPIVPLSPEIIEYINSKITSEMVSEIRKLSSKMSTF